MPTFKLPQIFGRSSSRALKIDSNEASKKSPELEISSNASNIPEVAMNIDIPQVVHDTTKEINIRDLPLNNEHHATSSNRSSVDDVSSEREILQEDLDTFLATERHNSDVTKELIQIKKELLNVHFNASHLDLPGYGSSTAIANATISTC